MTCSSSASRGAIDSGSKVITDPGQLGPDLLQVSLDSGSVGHGRMVAVGRITVIVSPGAARSEIVGRYGDAWKVRVAAPPERGRANAELTKLLASVLGVREQDVKLVAGQATRRKLVEVESLEVGEVERLLAQAAG